MASGGPPLLWQLDDPGHVVELPTPVPPPAVVPAACDRDGAQVSCPVFLGRAADAEVAVLRAALRRIGIPTAWVVAEDPDVTLCATVGGTFALHIGRMKVTPTVLWMRHFSARAGERGLTRVATRFREDSWRVLLDALPGRPVLGVGPAAPRQLAVTRAAGVRVPATVVTTRPALGAAAIPADRLILKALDSHFVEGSPGRLTGVYPQVVTWDEAARWNQPVGVPLVVQEYIEHEAEFRVYHLRGELRAFRVTKDHPAAPWLNPSRVRVRELPVPPAVAAAAGTVATALDLPYAAIDFLVAAGEPVFLEANPSGDWRWFETRARSHSVTDAAIGMVADLHHTVVGRSPLPLALFLTG